MHDRHHNRTDEVVHPGIINQIQRQLQKLGMGHQADGQRHLHQGRHPGLRDRQEDDTRGGTDPQAAADQHGRAGNQSH